MGATLTGASVVPRVGDPSRGESLEKTRNRGRSWSQLREKSSQAWDRERPCVYRGVARQALSPLGRLTATSPRSWSALVSGAPAAGVLLRLLVVASVHYGSVLAFAAPCGDNLGGVRIACRCGDTVVSDELRALGYVN